MICDRDKKGKLCSEFCISGYKIRKNWNENACYEYGKWRKPCWIFVEKFSTGWENLFKLKFV